jgi:LPS export ABC transporter protein LptC
VTEVTSAAGKILRGGEEVQLSGNVVLTRTPAPSGEVLTLNTDYLQVFPDTEIMQTSVPAKGSRGASRFEAPGFVMDNGARITELKGPGRLVIAPRAG